MRSISLTELKQQLGERILDVRRDGEFFIITRVGKPIAYLVPYEAGLLNDTAIAKHLAAGRHTKAEDQ